MSKKGNLDDKIRSVSAKIEKIKISNKPANVVKDLLEKRYIKKLMIMEIS